MIEPILFYTPNEGSVVDRDKGIIRGVSLITGGIKARGHDLHTDDTTLDQILACAQLAEQIPVKADHKSGIKETTGFVRDFSIKEMPDGKKKVVGDWHFLKSFSHRDQFLEMAEKMPKQFGLSVAFRDNDANGNPNKATRIEGKNRARCTELLAADVVTTPAANPGGLFSSQVDNANNQQMDTTTPAAQPTLADLMAAISALTGTVKGLTDRQTEADTLADERAQIEEGMATDPAGTIAALQGMDPAFLAKHGITSEDIAAVQAAITEAQGAETAESAEAAQEAAAAEAAAGGEVQTGRAPARGASANTAAAPVGAAVATALSALKGKVTYLEAFMKGETPEQMQEAAETAFNVLEEKVTMLAAENEALRRAKGPTTGRALRGTPGGINTPERAGKTTRFSALQEELKKANPNMNAGQIITLAATKDPAAYREFQVATGVITLD